MSTTMEPPNDTNIKQDLDIVARALPGKGPALARLIDRAGVTHSAIAKDLDCDRTAVSHWIAERKWPKPRRLLDLLIFLNIDRKLLADVSAILMGGDVAPEVFRATGRLNMLEVTRDQMLGLIQGCDSDHEQLGVVFRTFRPQVALSMALRASGLKGAESADPRAAQWFEGAYEKWLAEERRRTAPRERPVNSAQARAHRGEGILLEPEAERQEAEDSVATNETERELPPSLKGPRPAKEGKTPRPKRNSTR